ncbi:MAG: DUF1963 domain-containing protein [Polyangiales bacterium]
MLALPAADEPRLRYAAWLAERGETLRASVLRETRAQRVSPHLDSLLAELTQEHFGWSRLVGAQLVSRAQALDVADLARSWLALAKPALELTTTAPCDSVVGASRLWGDPDLPPNAPWPTLADCRQWEPEIELPLESPCRFVGQINFEELSTLEAAHALPRSGLLSVFAHSEWEATGSSSVCLRYYMDTTHLERTTHVATDEDNCRLEARGLAFLEALTIPECSGPFADRMGVASDDWDALDKHHEVRSATGGDLHGMLGHHQATSGGDPTPGVDWERLITLPIDQGPGVTHHLSMREDSLRTWRLEEHKLVWVDFDGP